MEVISHYIHVVLLKMFNWSDQFDKNIMDLCELSTCLQIIFKLLIINLLVALANEC